MNVYCTFYIHGDSVKNIISVLEQAFGASKKQTGLYVFPHFDIYLDENEEADANKMRTYPDGFLYYEFRAETEIYDQFIPVTDAIMKSLWEHQMPVVVSCDYEEELNRYIFSLS